MISSPSCSHFLAPSLLWIGGTLLAAAGLIAPGFAQESSCNLLDLDQQLPLQLESVEGEILELGNYPGGLQAVIWANRSTSTQAREAATRLRLEFHRYDPFRRVIVIDGTKVAAVEKLVSDSLRSSATEPDAPLLAVDFRGDRIAPLQELITQQLPDWEASEQAVLVILNGMGRVLSLHTLEGSIESARQCLRDQVRQLNLEISSVDLFS